MNDKNSFTVSCNIGQKLNHHHNVDLDYRKNLQHTHECEGYEPIKILKDETEKNFSLSNEEMKKFLVNHKMQNGKSIEECCDEFNQKETHKDRHKNFENILDWKKKGNQGKKYFEEYEMILQFGNKDINDNKQFINCFGEKLDVKTSNEMLEEFASRLEKKLEGKIIITSEVIHNDEKSPHLHLTFIPCFYDEETKGFKVSGSMNSLAQSCLTEEQKERANNLAEVEIEEQEHPSIPNKKPRVFSSDSARRKAIKDEYSKQCFKLFEVEVMHETGAEILRERGFEFKNPGMTNAIHQSTTDYRKKEELKQFQEENQQLKKEMQETRKFSNFLSEYFEYGFDGLDLKQTLKRAKQYIDTLFFNNKKLQKKNEELVFQTKQAEEEKNKALIKLSELDTYKDTMREVGDTVYYSNISEEDIDKMLSNASPSAKEAFEEGYKEAKERSRPNHNIYR